MVQVKALQSDVSKEKDSIALMISTAELKVRHEMQSEIMNQYQKGLRDGHAMAKGLPLSVVGYEMSSPACSGGTASSGLSRVTEL